MAPGHFTPLWLHRSGLLLCTLLLCCGLNLYQCCYTCLIALKERQILCEYMELNNKILEADYCETAFTGGFWPLGDTTIAYSQLSQIETYLKTFDPAVREIDRKLPLIPWHNQFEKKMEQYVKGVQAIASGHPPEACEPPCGLQKQARRFNCTDCLEEDCDLPVTCELEDIHVKEYRRTDMSCNVTFALPETYIVIWKFAKHLRVTDLSYFKFQNRLHNDIDYIIRPTLLRHQGTYVCEIQDYEDDVLVEKFFYLNVSRRDESNGPYLKRLFKQIIARAGTNGSVWALRTREDRKSDFDIMGFLESQKPMTVRALALTTLVVFLVFLLVTFSCIACVYYISN